MTTLDPRNLSVLAYANGFTLWHASHPGHVDDLPRDFFDVAREAFRTGDIVLVMGTPVEGKPLSTAAIVVVTVTSDGVLFAPVASPAMPTPATTGVGNG